MERDIIFAGFGGQGVLTAGLIAAHAANACGRHVLWMPAYGGQMRGGKSYSLVKFSEEPICHPDVEILDVLVAMNLPSLEEFGRYVREDGLILLNSDTIPEDHVFEKPGVQIRRVPFASLARSAGNPKGANISALGVMLRETGYFDLQEFAAEMNRFFAEKGKGAYADMNTAALKKGYEYAAE